MAATFALGPDAPEAFGYWAEITLPDGTVLGPVVGPSTARVTPGTVVTLSFRQGVPASARPGVYTYTMYAGTYPDEVLAVHALPFSVAASSAGREADRRGNAPAPEGRWLAYDAEGRPLVAGAVVDLRLVAGEAGAVAAPPPVAASNHAGVELPAEVTLAPAYPNPSSSRTTLRFGLPEAQAVRLAVYDALGREVAVLLDGERAAGWHEATLDGRALASGVYLYRLEAGPFAQTRRLLLAR
jgi:hypothetical protein